MTREWRKSVFELSKRRRPTPALSRKHGIEKKKKDARECVEKRRETSRREMRERERN